MLCLGSFGVSRYYNIQVFEQQASNKRPQRAAFFFGVLRVRDSGSKKAAFRF